MILLDWCGSNFAWFCWSFVGFFGWRWVIGSETRVVCLSFGSLFGFVHSGGGGSRWLQWKKDRGRETKIRERREMGVNRYGFGLYYFIV